MMCVKAFFCGMNDSLQIHQTFSGRLTLAGPTIWEMQACLLYSSDQLPKQRRTTYKNSAIHSKHKFVRILARRISKYKFSYKDYSLRILSMVPCFHTDSVSLLHFG